MISQIGFVNTSVPSFKNLGDISSIPGALETSRQHSNFFFKLGFTSCKAEQPLQGMELQEKETQKDKGTQKICLVRTYS